MGRMVEDIRELIGNTPLLHARKIEQAKALGARLLLKLECFNPAGSAKDRAALWMIEDARARGALAPGGTIVEPTSGNTGIALAAVGVPMGYRVILTMPESMSIERRALLSAYGAQLVLTPAAQGMAGAIERAQQIARETPGSFMPGQFDNAANPRAHYETTGPEIFRDANGQVDVLVAGVGTGGTLTGTAGYLKERIPGLLAVAVEPAGSPLLSGGHAGAHGLQGIGANFVPENLDRALVDEVMTVTEEQAYQAARLLVARQGILCGITSGAALHAAILLAERESLAGKTIVAVLPDTGDRYLSTPLFA